MGERFYRASNAVTAHIPGTGLGLRMVQAIVSNHHGTFGLSSQEGQRHHGHAPAAPPARVGDAEPVGGGVVEEQTGRPGALRRRQGRFAPMR